MRLVREPRLATSRAHSRTRKEGTPGRVGASTVNLEPAEGLAPRCPSEGMADVPVAGKCTMPSCLHYGHATVCVPGVYRCLGSCRGVVLTPSMCYPIAASICERVSAASDSSPHAHTHSLSTAGTGRRTVASCGG
jgi:hypothetical protein